MTVVAPLLVGVLYVTLMSLIKEPHRRTFNALMVAGAGAAYLSGGGLGAAELAFTAVLTYVAFRGLRSWTFIGIGWLLHTAWDVVHHLRGAPILPFAHDSSLGCAKFEVLHRAGSGQYHRAHDRTLCSVRDLLAPDPAARAAGDTCRARSGRRRHRGGGRGPG
jgi:hypothetical protein